MVDPLALAKSLCSKSEQLPTDAKIWLESYLYPSRIRQEEQKAWKTRCDMAIGHFELAKSRDNQIQSNGEWVCIAESKWFSDIHVNDKFPEINQLTRIIDHALLLHDKRGRFPERVYVTLITPRYFKERRGKFSDRLYWSKYNDYKLDPKKLENDLRLCPFQPLKHDIATLISRIEVLSLRWVTFEELLGLPNLVVDHVPKKHRVTINSWKEVFVEMGELELYNNLLGKFERQL
jgi:hypothetical protein